MFLFQKSPNSPVLFVRGRRGLAILCEENGFDIGVLDQHKETWANFGVAGMSSNTNPSFYFS
jgi:hypothetical protein